MLTDIGTYHRLALLYHTDLVALWGEAREKWLTDKAKINELVKFIPHQYRIERQVFKKENKKGIKRAMQKALKRNYWVGLRSCYLYQPLGRAPWVMALKSRRAIRLFFKKRKKGERKLWLGTPAHYNEWLADPGLKEVVVMFNPKRLCPIYPKEHLVARIEVFENNLRVEMKVNTEQLRELENGTQRGDLIILNMAPKDTFRFERGPIIASFGQHYFKKKVKLPQKKSIEMLDGVYGEFRTQIKNYQNLIKPQALKIASQVAKIVYDEWCGAPFNLYYRLQALREFGLGTLEVQARQEKEKIKYFLVYGLRGTREVSRVIP
jgi:hypothetical protein